MEVRAAQDELRRAIQAAALTNDPMRYALEALAVHLGATHHLFVDGNLTLAEQIRRAQQPISDESLHRLEQAAVTGADRRAFGIIREHWRRNILLAAGALFGIALLFGAGGVAGGYVWGRANALSQVHETEAGLREMFANGANAAALWRDWASWNDPQQMLAQCKGNATFVQNDRRACLAPLWISAPKGR